jgi:uncharacterized protein (UPF0371 family)
MKDKELRKALQDAGLIDCDSYLCVEYDAKKVIISGIDRYWKDDVDGNIKHAKRRIAELEQKLEAVMELLNITEEDKKRVLKKGKKEVELGKKVAGANMQSIGPCCKSFFPMTETSGTTVTDISPSIFDGLL